MKGKATVPSTKPSLSGVSIERLSGDRCVSIVDWLAGRAESPALGPELHWALAHSDDGVTWFRRDPNGWRSGHGVYPEISPPLRAPRLQELRVFGVEAEVLIWRAEGGLRGRLATDAAVEKDAPPPLDEARLLRGEGPGVAMAGEFTHVQDAAGAEQVLPLLWPCQVAERPALRCRHYFECCPETGVSRVALTRLLEVCTLEVR